MIDCEFELFTEVATALRASFDGIYVTGEYVRTPARFPCVSIEERDNTAWRNSRTNENYENHAAVMYEINVYSNKQTGKKAEAKAIAEVADGVMQKLGFTRTMLSPTQNLADATIYRITGRYSGIVQDNGNNNYTIYKR
jgi:hypothetical protein